jgi:hypothetical protein
VEKYEIEPAFDMLLEELERIIPDLNAQSKEMLDQKRYTQARELIGKVEAVVAFQDRVASLRHEWLKMQVPSTKVPQPELVNKPPKGKKISMQTDKPRMKPRLQTQKDAFQMPILSVLVKNGGSLQFQQLLSELEIEMKDQLNEYDWEMLNDGRSIRWKTNARWAKMLLMNAGYISNTAGKGVLEITPLGRKFLVENR